MRLKPETQEMIMIFDWIRLQPALRDCAFHIPNEGKRSYIMGHIMKRSGLRAGVADIFIAKACKGYHGLWIELKAMNKTGKFGKPTDLQLDFLHDMEQEGYLALVAYGGNDAIDKIKQYLG